MPDPRIWPVPAVTDTFATVTAVSAIVLAANPRRVEADFINDGDYIIYLARGHDAVVGSGQRLNAQGGSYHTGIDNLFHGDIYGIAEVAIGQGNTNLSISEGYKPA